MSFSRPWIIIHSLLLWTLSSVTGVTVTNIRLVNPDPNSPDADRAGRLEIQVDNNAQWGTVCDDKFGKLDAVVACRMLSFPNGEAILNGTFGTVSLPFLLDETDCRGDEDSLSDCIASMETDCIIGSDQQVGVVCERNTGNPTANPIVTTTQAPIVIGGNCQVGERTVRLFGKAGFDGIGLVQVRNPATQTWGYVCDDGWDENAARVVCAQLCYPSNFTALPGVPAEHRVDPPVTLIILDNVQCAGTESTLQDCPHAPWGVEDCKEGASELAGVQCVEARYQPPPAPIPVLECREGLMIAQFLRSIDPNLEEKHLSVFAGKCADALKSTSPRYVTITIPVDKCGTRLLRNGSHIVYTNEVRYNFTSQAEFITRVNTYRIGLECSLPVGGEITQRVEPLTEFVTQKSTGNFRVTMEIYRNGTFENPETTNPVQIPLGEVLNMAVVLEDSDPGLKLVVPTCIATPTGNTDGVTKKILFQDKCSQEETLSFYPISNFKFGFRFRPFRFVGLDLLYISCDFIVCLANATTSECDRTCQNTKPVVSGGRRKRSARDVMLQSTVSTMAIVLFDPHKDTDEEEDFKVIIPDKGPLTWPASTATPPSTDIIHQPNPSSTSLASTSENRNDISDAQVQTPGDKASSLSMSVLVLWALFVCAKCLIYM